MNTNPSLMKFSRYLRFHKFYIKVFVSECFFYTYLICLIARKYFLEWRKDVFYEVVKYFFSKILLHFCPFFLKKTLSSTKKPSLIAFHFFFISFLFQILPGKTFPSIFFALYIWDCHITKF